MCVQRSLWANAAHFSASRVRSSLVEQRFLTPPVEVRFLTDALGPDWALVGLYFPGSSNGRTCGSEPLEVGSNPAPGTQGASAPAISDNPENGVTACGEARGGLPCKRAGPMTSDRARRI
jgi:hypothetical protein